MTKSILAISFFATASILAFSGLAAAEAAAQGGDTCGLRDPKALASNPTLASIDESLAASTNPGDKVSIMVPKCSIKDGTIKMSLQIGRHVKGDTEFHNFVPSGKLLPITFKNGEDKVSIHTKVTAAIAKLQST